MSALVDVLREIRANLLLWLALLVAFFAAFPLLQLALLIVRFQEFPNYLTVHDWPGNIARIVRMTAVDRRHGFDHARRMADRNRLDEFRLRPWYR